MLKTFFSNLLDIQTADPDDARRRKVLNVLLTGIFVCAFFGLILILLGVMGNISPSEIAWLITACIIFMLGSVLIYMLNRKHGKTAAYLFLLLLTVAFTFSDTPANVLNGRSLFVYAIPISVASLLIHPLASFLFAGLTAVIMVALANLNGIGVNVPAIIGYIMLGLISWLSANALERALAEVRLVNANLDRLVQERTQALISALGRERSEAGRNRAILESIADGVIVFDLRGRATHINPALVRLLETPEENLTGISIDELTRAPALDAKNRGILAGLLAGSGQQISSYRIQWGKKTLSVSSAQVADINGERIGTVAVFRDYTREAEIERMKNTFLAVVSHELRTPLNAILGYAEMLKEAIYGPVNEKQVRASDRIISNARRLLDIVNDLLDQAQIEAGKMTFRMQPFQPAVLLENVLEVTHKTAADKGLALTGELDPELPETINGDLTRLQQILLNLTTNAIKFTDRGSVHIRLFRPNKKQWSIEVTDTGVGIPDEELPHIFEAFRQADSTLTRRHGGFGLGLTIVQQLANLMGGAVTVKSKIGVGSVFTVTLPLVGSKK